jgi:hypothetical protein
MRYRPKSDELQAQTITRLVDDSLTAGERADFEAWAGQNPEVGRQVAAQRRVVQALRDGGPDVPAGLVGAVQSRIAASEQRDARRRLPGGLGWRPAIAGAAVAALCAVAIVLVVGTAGGSGTPTINAAAKLAFAPSTGAAPAASSATLLDVSYAGVQYPNYAREFAVLPTGTRVDRIGGRQALTVFYQLPNGSRLSYTVFSGAPIPLPPGTRTVVFRGVPLHVLPPSSGLAVVTLVRFGRTCVLAAPTARDIVLALAAAPVLERA